MSGNQFNVDIEINELPKIKTDKTPDIMRVSSREPVPVEIKKKVIDRSKKICEYPKCKRGVILEFHHKNMKNNDNRATNIELLCPDHHRTKNNSPCKKT